MFPQIWTQIKHYHKDDEEDKLDITTNMKRQIRGYHKYEKTN